MNKTLEGFKDVALRPSPPWFYFTSLSTSDVEEALWPPKMLVDHQCVVRWIRAQSMRSEAELHSEIAAALQFPSYYGRNWHALRDCLRDLAWGSGASFILVVESCEQLLSSEPPKVLSSFTRLLGDFASELTEPYEWSDDRIRPITPFHVLFQSDAKASETALMRLADAGVSPEVLNALPE